MTVDDMTEDEFKITVRAFFPTIGFASYFEGGTRVVIADYFYHDTYGMVGRFHYTCDEYGNVSVWFGVLPPFERTDMLVDLVKNMRHNGWETLMDHFMRKYV